MIERRSYTSELRAEGDGLPRITGHAAVFDQLSEEMGYFAPFRERIAPGAFDGALERVRSGQDIVYALFNHDENLIISSTADRTLDLSVDEMGLFAEMTPMDTQTIRDLVVQPIKEGKVRKMSFGFTVADEHDEKRDGQTVRVIDRIDRLFDVSPVTYPAYPQTDVQARKLLASLGLSHESPAVRAQVSRLAAEQRRPAGASAGLLRRRLDLREHART